MTDPTPEQIEKLATDYAGTHSRSTMRVVKELEAVEIAAVDKGLRRIIIIERDDGFYAFAEQYYYVSEYDGEIISQGWHTISRNGIFETSQVAETEGRDAFCMWYGVAY
ncbi:hypothetical protein [Agrobacterium sp. DSM 25558]|uniref:hypothetical protein n=1 Tax=Agrobacterium sp. DSM 25558 TaxID=1907665 RepID=UPI00097D5690|nr:hypothetical protein [Agrobacterium sp. DSM 25558]